VVTLTPGAQQQLGSEATHPDRKRLLNRPGGHANIRKLKVFASVVVDIVFESVADDVQTFEQPPPALV